MEAGASMLPFSAVHIFRPSLLVGQRKEFRLGEKLAEWIARPLSGLMSGRLLKFAPVNAETVAEAMAAVARGETKGVAIHESDEIARLGGKLGE